LKAKAELLLIGVVLATLFEAPALASDFSMVVIILGGFGLIFGTIIYAVLRFISKAVEKSRWRYGLQWIVVCMAAVIISLFLDSMEGPYITAKDIIMWSLIYIPIAVAGWFYTIRVVSRSSENDDHTHAS
jgi:Sec-independent protein secretion pathway component TatC